MPTAARLWSSIMVSEACPVIRKCTLAVLLLFGNTVKVTEYSTTDTVIHCFRIFYQKQWPAQDYWNFETSSALPGGMGPPMPNYATNVNSANYAKRQIIKSVLEGKLKTVDVSEEDLETATLVVDQYGGEAAIVLNKWEDPSSPRPTTAALVTDVSTSQSYTAGSTTSISAAARMTESESARETGLRRHASRHGHGHRKL